MVPLAQPLLNMHIRRFISNSKEASLSLYGILILASLFEQPFSGCLGGVVVNHYIP